MADLRPSRHEADGDRHQADKGGGGGGQGNGVRQVRVTFCKKQ